MNDGRSVRLGVQKGTRRIGRATHRGRLLAALLIVAASATCAEAHSGVREITIPREALGRPAPVVDGTCGAFEYANAGRVPILYRPRVDEEPATIYWMATDLNLYVCLKGLPRRRGTVMPFVSIALDMDHDGGRVPDADDLRFILTEDGQRDAERGDGRGGFATDPALTAWDTRVLSGVGAEFQWGAEFRISHQLVGPFLGGLARGMLVRHNWLRFQGDDYFHHPTSQWNVPNTWMDVLWGYPRRDVQVLPYDVRVTQGLEEDLSAGVYHHLVAGKGFLTRVSLWNPGPPRTVTQATCEAQRIFASTAQPVESVEAVPEPDAPVIPLPSTPNFFGPPRFNCWFSGRDVTRHGTYRIAMRVTLSDGSTHRVRLGRHSFELTPHFEPSGRLRLILFAAERPGGRAWGRDLAAAIPNNMGESYRMFPIGGSPTPIGSPLVTTRAEHTGFHIPSAGFRYFLHPSVIECEAGGCAGRSRSFANGLLDLVNRQWEALERQDGTPRERLDFGEILSAETAALGGQSCWSGHRVGTQGFDAHADLGSASLLVHEIAHCHGLVRPDSPNLHPTNGLHSAHSGIARRAAAVNLRSKSDIERPASLMFPSVGVGERAFFEGWEWNDLGATIYFSRERRQPAGAGAALPRTALGFLHVFGVIDEASAGVTVLYSQAEADDGRQETPDDPDGDYELGLWDAGGTKIAGARFDVDFDAPDDDSGEGGFDVTIPLSANAAELRITQGGVIRYSSPLTAAPPLVSNVTAAGGGADRVNLSWDASDPDGPALTFNVYYQASADVPPVVVETGLTGTGYVYRSDVTGAASDARLVVEASDGLHTHRAASNPFSIPARAPAVAISSPKDGTFVVAGQPITLTGAAFDYTSGSIAGFDLEWESDRLGFLGAGEQLDVRLSEGAHQLTLTAFAPSGVSDADTVQVVALRDSDADGLSDVEEGAHGCLDRLQADSTGDPDLDGLTSLAEVRAATDPCDPDTDLDGQADGDEAAGGADPRDPANQVARHVLFPSADEIDLGTCSLERVRTVRVETGPADLLWSVDSNAPWLIAAGGGVGDGDLAVSVDCLELEPGSYEGKVMISGAGQARSISVHVEQTLCATEPRTSCRQAEKSSLIVVDKPSEAKDSIKWKWTRGDATDFEAFGAPSTETSFALCLYDGRAGAEMPSTQIVIPPNPRWTSVPGKKWKYRDEAGLADGAQQLKLKAGAAGKAGITFKARGARVPMPGPGGDSTYFEQEPSVRVQLVNADGECWESRFVRDATTRNDAGKFKAVIR